MSMAKSVILTIIIVIALVIIAGPIIVNLTADWLWFDSLGLTEIFSTILLTRLAVGLGIGLVTFGVLYLNAYLAYRFTRDEPIVLKPGESPGRQPDVSAVIVRLLLPVTLFIGIMTGLVASAQWQTVQEFLHGVSFGTTDPLYGRDLSYYFFTLPFIRMLLGFAFWMTIISFIAAAFQYLVRGVLRIRNRQVQTARHAKRHLSILLAVFFLLIAGSLYFNSMPNLLYSNTGPFTGASYTDVHASLPVLWGLLVIALLIAVVLIINLFRRVKRIVPILIGLYIIVGIVGGVGYPVFVQRLIVLPNELDKETPYIERNIAATQQAFGLDQVTRRELAAEDIELTSQDIADNQLTIKNVRLWDRTPLLDTFGQIQEIRTYYDFVSIDNDRYTINDEYRQTMLSPRELNTASLPSATFINERLVFTHGYGIALGPVNEVTPEGLPLLFVQDLPPKSSTESVSVERPEIYFGELVSDYVFVQTNAEEFNYPSGDENVFTTYQGEGGVAVDSLLKKALFAADLQSLKILLSGDITNDSKVLLHRNITDRVKKALPFLEYDGDPYMIITENGELKWMYDAYTTSNAYPYAESVISLATDVTRTPGSISPRLNYIRNSVKVVIDAYTGAMDAYVADPDDPLIQTYQNIFPDTLVSMDAMAADIRAHVRYPEDIYRYQTAIYGTYHMEQSQIFYNKEDKWEIPQIGQDRKDPMMRHMIMKLPDEDQEEFILMLPFTPRNKDNLAAWMVARSDGEHYGELVVYRFPKQKLVFGPKQIANRINQDADISQQVSLWDQRGSSVNFGNLLVIPIEEALIYVQPLYLRADQGTIPELKRVIVAYENQIGMAKTLDQALAVIFSGADEPAVDPIVDGPTEPEQDTDEPAQTQADLISEANTRYQNALDAQRRGNWTTYGQEIEALGNILDQLE